MAEPANAGLVGPSATDSGRSMPSRLKGPWCAKLASLLVLGGALAATLVAPPRPRLIWNASASSPIGLYQVTSRHDLKRGDLAVAWPPAWAKLLGAERHYLPLNVPLLKHVAALEGDTVCIRGPAVFVGARFAAQRRIADGAGRRMPWGEGCKTLEPGEAFLFDAGQADAFDGRYFGISSNKQIIGKARLIWRG